MRAVIYARYSSDKQDADSIAAQVRACSEYADAKKYQIVTKYIDEAVSGRTTRREAFQRLIEDSSKGLFEVVLIHKYDRIARSLRDHVMTDQMFREKGIDLIAVAQDFGGGNEAKIIKALMWSMSEYYSDNLATEVRKGLKENALKGLHNGGNALFGYRVVDQQYEINEAEAFYVRKMFDCALNNKGFKRLVDEMAENGIVGRFGKPIRYTQIYEMLRNERYTGTYLYMQGPPENREAKRKKKGAIRVDNALPAIIDKQTWVEVQKIMESRKHSGRKAEYLCNGLVYCECGAKMYPTRSTKGGNEYMYYYCSKKCGYGIIHMDIIDSAAKRYLLKLLSSENRSKIAHYISEVQKGFEVKTKSFNSIQQKRIDDLQGQIDNAVDTIVSSRLPDAALEAVGNRITSLKQQIEDIKKEPEPQYLSYDKIIDWLKVVESTPADKAIVRQFISKIVADKENPTVYSQLADTVGMPGLSGGT